MGCGLPVVTRFLVQRGRPYLHDRSLLIRRRGVPQAGAPGQDAVPGHLFGEGLVLESASALTSSLVEATGAARRRARRSSPWPLAGLGVQVQRDHEGGMRLLGQLHDGELPEGDRALLFQATRRAGSPGRYSLTPQSSPPCPLWSVEACSCRRARYPRRRKEGAPPRRRSWGRPRPRSPPAPGGARRTARKAPPTRRGPLHPSRCPGAVLYGVPDGLGSLEPTRTATARPHAIGEAVLHLQQVPGEAFSVP